MIFTATTFSHNNYLAAANFKFQKVKGPPRVTFPVLGLLQWLEIGCWLLQLKALAINCSTCRASQLSRWHLWYYLATPLPFQLYYSTTCNISTLKEWSWGAKATRPDLTANSLSLSLSLSLFLLLLYLSGCLVYTTGRWRELQPKRCLRQVDNHPDTFSTT